MITCEFRVVRYYITSSTPSLFLRITARGPYFLDNWEVEYTWEALKHMVDYIESNHSYVRYEWLDEYGMKLIETEEDWAMLRMTNF